MEQLTECQIEIKKLRESTGMNRKEFCECFNIPYRTVTEWERGTRNAPDYVLRLLAYYIRMENIAKEKGDVKKIFRNFFTSPPAFFGGCKKPAFYSPL